MKLATYSTFGIAMGVCLTMLIPWKGVISQTQESAAVGSSHSERVVLETKPSKQMLASRQIQETLSQNCELNFEETEFVSVMELLREQYGLNCYLDQTAIDDSLAHDEPITFSAKDMHLGSALRLMLREHNTTFVVQNGDRLVHFTRCCRRFWILHASHV